VLNKSLTIVLPVYNGEAQLRKCVRELLELASELTAHFDLLIIDDGSTDATYEVAEELAARYPQVSIERRRHRRGLGPTIELARRRIRSDAVIVHDGITPIDPNQVRSLWRSCLAQPANGDSASAALQGDICDFANLPAIHAAMEKAHERVLGFQWVTPLASGESSILNEGTTPDGLPRTDAAHSTRRAGMGQIPAFPRPKFLAALAEFALGE
jgi:glycosyltransferase involved in cell wall biosynthesis